MKAASVRWSLRRQIGKANRLIGAQAKAHGVDFINVAVDLLVGDNPEWRYDSKDGLHLSPAGYGQWNRIVGSYLAQEK